MHSIMLLHKLSFIMDRIDIFPKEQENNLSEELLLFF